MNAQLNEPRNGYVTGKLNAPWNYSSITGEAVIYYSPHSNCRESYIPLMKLLDEGNATLIKRFEKNGKYAEVYRSD